MGVVADDVMLDRCVRPPENFGHAFIQLIVDWGVDRLLILSFSQQLNLLHFAICLVNVAFKYRPTLI